MSDSIKTTQTFAATGAGSDQFYGRARSQHTMQVKWTSNPTAVKATLEGSLDNGTSWATIATFDTADARVSGDAVTVTGASFDRTRPRLVTLTGGTAPSVTVITISET